VNGLESCVNALVEQATELDTAVRSRATAKTLAASMNDYFEGIGRPDLKTNPKTMRSLRESVNKSTDAGTEVDPEEDLYQSLAKLSWDKLGGAKTTLFE
jgi:hypothetical protein